MTAKHIRIFGAGCLILASILLGASTHIESIQPGSKDPVTAACDEYERLFRVASKDVAEQLRSGDLSDEQASRDYRAAALKQALKLAFDPLAKAEAKAFEGGWSKDKEIKVLEGYFQ